MTVDLDSPIREIQSLKVLCQATLQPYPRSAWITISVITKASNMDMSILVSHATQVLNQKIFMEIRMALFRKEAHKNQERQVQFQPSLSCLFNHLNFMVGTQVLMKQEMILQLFLQLLKFWIEKETQS